MANHTIMIMELDQQRKRQALFLTLGIGAGLLLLFILLKWPIPTLEQPIADEYIEVNLGNGDVGSGNDQPMEPGDPAPAQATYTPPQAAPASNEAARAVETDENAPSDAPVIRNPAISKPDATRIDDNSKVTRTNPTPTPAPPAPPAPKARMGRISSPGATGPGGNAADSYKPGTGEGPGNGAGDAGRPGGSPTGGRYDGAPRRNDRQMIERIYYFQGDLPPAVVYADLRITPDGRASFIKITKGYNTAQYRNAIVGYLPSMKFNKSDHESIVNFKFNFIQSGGN
ncbi:hypothetical protein [Flaviaesturariibacter amylovorans]|uniref:Energy transducer TonB n=1 Tax=Flaviaesturariibacter amylovorans TaxID=1084520 RepID=A0ABP8GUT8_9BACT